MSCNVLTDEQLPLNGIWRFPLKRVVPSEAGAGFKVSFCNAVWWGWPYFQSDAAAFPKFNTVLATSAEDTKNVLGVESVIGSHRGKMWPFWVIRN